jgi:hypothetical protein
MGGYLGWHTQGDEKSDKRGNGADSSEDRGDDDAGGRLERREAIDHTEEQPKGGGKCDERANDSQQASAPQEESDSPELLLERRHGDEALSLKHEIRNGRMRY